MYVVYTGRLPHTLANRAVNNTLPLEANLLDVSLLLAVRPITHTLFVFNDQQRGHTRLLFINFELSNYGI